jgi:hypothetical protein
MAEQCPIIGNDGVYGQVTTVMANMWGNAQTAFGVSLEALQELGDFALNPIAVAAQFNPDHSWWHVQRPTAPDRPELVYDPNMALVPAPPSVDTGPDPGFVAPPTFTATPPVLPVRQGPGPLSVEAPDGPPALDEVVVPDTPTLVLPDFPELREIVLPDAPDVMLPTFQGVRPSFDVAIPVNTFGFTAEHYDSALLGALRSKLQVMVNGAPGLPDAAARAMRDRAYSAVDVQGLRAEQEAIEQFAARGFSEPDGTLARRLHEVRQNNQNERNKLSRDIYLEDVKIAIEDLRFAVAQGIALESALMSNFLAVQQLMLDAAKTAIQVAIDIANAEIAVRNLELDMFKADAQVFRDLIQAELAKIEVFKAQLEGQRLVGELNQQDVQIFAERVRAVLAMVELYKAEVDGAKAKADVNLSRVQAFAATVDAYKTRIEAYETEWDAFGKQLDADLSQYRRYELETQVFGNRVKIWSDINSNKIDQKRLRIDEKELDLNAYRARLEQLRTVIGAEGSRLDALARVYGIDIDKYRADAAVEQIVSEGNARPFQLAMEQERTRVDTSLKNADLRINQALKMAEILAEVKKSIAQIGAQLSAGFASAMSVHAGLSSSLSQSTGCSTTFNYRLSE